MIQGATLERYFMMDEHPPPTDQAESREEPGEARIYEKPKIEQRVRLSALLGAEAQFSF